MKIVELSSGWSLRRVGTKRSYAAQVPGSISLDLSATEEVAQWRAREWVYECVVMGAELPPYDQALLCFDGLNGAATVSINGTTLGGSTNLFERHSFDVTAHLKAGKNTLCVNFTAPSEGGERVGIADRVRMKLFRGARISRLKIEQCHAAAGISLSVAVDAQRFDDVAYNVTVRLYYHDVLQSEARQVLRAERMVLELPVKNAQLWWPVGMGEQPLYEVVVEIGRGKSYVTQLKRRVGLRHLTVDEAMGGNPTLLINGQPLFLKGATWIPRDVVPARQTRVEYAKPIQQAAAINLNCLRVWGGGAYEQSAFYELCDEYGLCVWHDFMLDASHAAKPTAAELETFRREAVGVVARLHHHAAMLLWGGGAVAEVNAAYQEVARAAVRECGAGAHFLSARAHQPLSLGKVGACGLAPGLPEPNVMGLLLGDAERNLSHWECERYVSAATAKQIYDNFIDNFLLPAEFGGILWLSQIQQGVATLESYRESRFGDANSGGLVGWKLIDRKPQSSASLMDFEGRWKAVAHILRRYMAPLSVCAVQRGERATIFVTNEKVGITFRGVLQWGIYKTDGNKLEVGECELSVAAGKSLEAAEVSVAAAIAEHGAQNVVLCATVLDRHGYAQASDMLIFCKWKALNSFPPRLRVEIRMQDNGNFTLTVSSRAPAFWVWLAIDGSRAQYDNNFFCLEPERPLRLRVMPSERLKLAEVRERLRISSLRDTWQVRRGH